MFSVKQVFVIAMALCVCVSMGDADEPHEHINNTDDVDNASGNVKSTELVSDYMLRFIQVAENYGTYTFTFWVFESVLGKIKWISRFTKAAKKVSFFKPVFSGLKVVSQNKLKTFIAGTLLSVSIDNIAKTKHAEHKNTMKTATSKKIEIKKELTKLHDRKIKEQEKMLQERNEVIGNLTKDKTELKKAEAKLKEQQAKMEADHRKQMTILSTKMYMEDQKFKDAADAVGFYEKNPFEASVWYFGVAIMEVTYYRTKTPKDVLLAAAGYTTKFYDVYNKVYYDPTTSSQDQFMMGLAPSGIALSLLYVMLNFAQTISMTGHWILVYFIAVVYTVAQLSTFHWIIQSIFWSVFKATVVLALLVLLGWYTWKYTTVTTYSMCCWIMQLCYRAICLVVHCVISPARGVYTLWKNRKTVSTSAVASNQESGCASETSNVESERAARLARNRALAQEFEEMLTNN